LLAVNEERYVRELPARILGLQPDPNAIVPPPPAHDIVLPTPKRRRKGPCMSRRRGQTGYVWQKNQSGSKNWDATIPAYGQVWVDVPGKEKRQRKFYQLGECRTKSEARRRLKEMIEKDGINSTVDIAQSIDSITFGQQAELWIKAIEDGRVLHRAKRTRIKPATITGYKSAIEWMSPHIGKVPLANIKNAAAKELITAMKQAELSDKTIVNYIHVLQSIIASVVNGEGEQVHPRTWDSHFIGLPVVNPRKQNRPTRTAKEIEKILAAVAGRHRVLYSLLAGRVCGSERPSQSGWGHSRMIARQSPRIVPRSTFGRLSGAGRSKTPKQTRPSGMWTFQRNSQLCCQKLSATAKEGSYSARPAANHCHHATFFATTCTPRFSRSNNQEQGFTALGAFANPCSKCQTLGIS